MRTSRKGMVQLGKAQNARQNLCSRQYEMEGRNDITRSGNGSEQVRSSTESSNIGGLRSHPSNLRR
jgi:hypothetical protein